MRYTHTFIPQSYKLIFVLAIAGITRIGATSIGEQGLI